MEEKTRFVCRGLYMARWMINNGYELAETQIDKRNPKFNIFIFYVDEQVDEIHDKYHQWKRTHDVTDLYK